MHKEKEYTVTLGQMEFSFQLVAKDVAAELLLAEISRILQESSALSERASSPRQSLQPEEDVPDQ